MCVPLFVFAGLLTVLIQLTETVPSAVVVNATPAEKVHGTETGSATGTQIVTETGIASAIGTETGSVTEAENASANASVTVIVTGVVLTGTGAGSVSATRTESASVSSSGNVSGSAGGEVAGGVAVAAGTGSGVARGVMKRGVGIVRHRGNLRTAADVVMSAARGVIGTAGGTRQGRRRPRNRYVTRTTITLMLPASPTTSNAMLCVCRAPIRGH